MNVFYERDICILHKAKTLYAFLRKLREWINVKFDTLKVYMKKKRIKLFFV